MKKMVKVFFVLILLSVFSSSYSTNELTTCEVAAVNFHNDLIDAGFSHAYAYQASAAFQTVCEEAFN